MSFFAVFAQNSNGDTFAPYYAVKNTSLSRFLVYFMSVCDEIVWQEFATYFIAHIITFVDIFAQKDNVSVPVFAQKSHGDMFARNHPAKKLPLKVCVL